MYHGVPVTRAGVGAAMSRAARGAAGVVPLRGWTFVRNRGVQEVTKRTALGERERMGIWVPHSAPCPSLPSVIYLCDILERFEIYYL